jgi:glucosyl-dolichyl phosphate glucuronosyltransferase
MSLSPCKLRSLVHPLLSIVLTSFSDDRKGEIVELLESICKQTYPNIELVYVVERSVNLFIFLKKFAKEKGINAVILFSNKKLGLAGARNLGITKASGDIIAFIDDDVLLPSIWATEVVSTYDLSTSIIGVTGPANPLWENTEMNWLPEQFYWLISCTGWSQLKSQQEVRSAWGMNMSFRREAFALTGLFDPEISGYHKPIGEDLYLSLKVKKKTGCKIFFNANTLVFHRVYAFRFSWGFIARRSLHIGKSRIVFKKISGNTVSSDQENNLLKSILQSSLVDARCILLNNPTVFLKRLLLTCFSLFFVFIGILHGCLKFGYKIIELT